MRKRKITGRILTGLALLIGVSGTVAVANEINNIASNINVKSVKSNIVEKNGHYYVQLTADKAVKNVVARITTEDKKEYLVKKDEIKIGEVAEYEIDVNAEMSTKKLPHTAVKRETVKNVVSLGNHTFTLTVRYDIEDNTNKDQPLMVVSGDTTKNSTLDKLVEKREVTAEEKIRETEAKVKQETEVKAKQEAEAKQGITVAKGLPTVTAAELADPAMNGLTDHAKKMKVALAKKFGITSFSMYRADDDNGTGHGHGTGMSVDFMVPVGSAQGDQLAEYLTKNMKELGIYYVIWKQRFYMPQHNIYGPANTWNLMLDRGGVTVNHYDHEHVSFIK